MIFADFDHMTKTNLRKIVKMADEETGNTSFDEEEFDYQENTLMESSLRELQKLKASKEVYKEVPVPFERHLTNRRLQNAQNLARSKSLTITTTSQRIPQSSPTSSSLATRPQSQQLQLPPPPPQQQQQQQQQSTISQLSAVEKHELLSELIEYVRSYESIWNVSSPLWKDRDKKEDAWRRISR